MTPGSYTKAQVIRDLISRLDAIEAEASTWQASDLPPKQDEIDALRNAYVAWYAEAQRFVPPESIDRFKDRYEGGYVVKRIKHFLNAPLEANILANPADPNNPFGSFQYAFDDAFRGSAADQRTILYEAVGSDEPLSVEMERLAAILTRVPEYLSRLVGAGAPVVEKESDLQALLHPLLIAVYGDVRREDLVPQFAGGGSRVDFLIRDLGVILEVKMTRATLNDSRVGSELLVDWARYRSHPDCLAIFALIYDPGRRIVNTIGLQADLTDAAAVVPTSALIVH